MVAEIERAIGTNLDGIADWSTQRPFLDAFKSSRDWLTQEGFTWDTQESDLLDIDENGWVRALPASEDTASYDSVGTILYTAQPEPNLSGQYLVLYDGQGTIEYRLDAEKDEAASSPGRDVINIDSPRNGTGDYIRNIQFVRVPDEGDDASQIFAPTSIETTNEGDDPSQIFNPTFIDRVEDFSVLRFMDWMETNNSDQNSWSDRPTLQDARYSTDGVPVEVMVELANQTDRDPWFTMPHQATDEYVINFATYVRDNLEPGRKVYVEYSNEVWNAQFEQRQWVLERAREEFGDSVNEGFLVTDWFSKRTTEITQLWDEVFGGDNERVIGVMGAQAGNVGVASRALDYEWAEQPLSNEEYGIDAIAIAPYFGYYIGLPEYASQVEAWTQEPDGGLDKLFDELTEGDLLNDEHAGGALQKSYDWIATHAELSQQEDLQLLAYEGGQHLVGVYGNENNEAITNLFIEANRDPRMGDIYQEYLQKWFELGGSTFINFNNVRQPDKFGSWGLLESIDSESSPKYDAVIDVIEALE
jgi:hypothetical protein